MEYERLKRLGIVGVASRHAGAFVGTAAVVGKKIVGLGVGGVVTVRDLLTRPVEGSTLVTDEQVGPRSEARLQRTLEPRVKKVTAREHALIALVAALESDLAAAQRELEKTRRPEKDAKSQLSSDVGAVRAETETVLSGRGEEKVAVVPAEQKVASSMEATAARPVRNKEVSNGSRGDEQVNVGIEEQQSRAMPEAEAPGPADVTPEQVRAAVFSDAAKRIIFTRALSDIASQDAAVRIDAARAMAGVRHELSVRALVAQMAREPSPQVQQECIKALTTLEMTEGLGAVERALTDRAASVRLAAVWGLYHLAKVESAPALAHMLSDEDGEVRRRAAVCIGWLGQEELAVELLPLLADSSVSVRRVAVEAMGNLHSRQVVSALIERLNDPDESISKAVLSALETITGKKMGEPFPADQKSHQRLIARWREWWKEQQPEM